MKIVLLTFSFLLIYSCGTKPQPINYGSDACSFCQMTIVDRQHSAEIVTVKGKSYKYDAIECMMNDLSKWKRPDVALFLVADYDRPGELIDATNANYLISEDIPSPMGEFLSAFGDDISMDGEKFNWASLKERFEVK